MEEQNTITKTDLPLPLFIKGKVRDTYELGDKLLIIATDRISTFDVVMPDSIPDKGKVLNQLSAFWFEKTKHILPNHLVEVVDNTKVLDKYIPNAKRFPYPAWLTGRSMIVKKAQRLPLEWVIRGYLSGSAWEEYKTHGTISGEPMPLGLKESQELPEPLFTPTTKADTGHDLPITMNDVSELIVGSVTNHDKVQEGSISSIKKLLKERSEALTQEMKEKSLAVYNYARRHAIERGIIIADTKMEFGLDNGKLILIDEVLTPDSSRFWDAEKYKVGQSQPSYDKQPVRDYLVQAGWNKEPPAPTLPPEVIEATTNRYRLGYRKLTGKDLK